jgi:superfamily I DNA/RNA helicase
MQSNNHVIVACAGGGKTTCIIERALAQQEERVLITTYTNENLFEIRKKIIDLHGFVPENLTINSWYTMLFHDFVRPYQKILLPEAHIRSVDFVSTPPRFASRDDNPKSYFLNKNFDIYRDRVSDFVFHCNNQSKGLIIKRLEQIYGHIYIDEMQDLAGWDFDIVELLMESSILITMVGDPRQNTFQTNNSIKNKGFTFQRWVEKLKTEKGCIEEHRTQCYRSNQAICNFADALYPEYPRTSSFSQDHTGHDGVFFIPANDIHSYIEEFNPQILRHSIKSNTYGYVALNFGLSKGKTFDRVLIVPTKPIKEYLQSKDPSGLQPRSKSLLYVAITRAKFSVAFIMD